MFSESLAPPTQMLLCHCCADVCTVLLRTISRPSDIINDTHTQKGRPGNIFGEPPP